MGHIGNWVLGGFAVLMAMGGLFVASRAGEEVVAYWGGLAMFVFSVAFVFYLIKSALDEAEHGQR